MIKNKINHDKENEAVLLVKSSNKNLRVFFVSFVFTSLFLIFSIGLSNRQVAILQGIKNDIHQDLEFLKTTRLSDKDALNR